MCDKSFQLLKTENQNWPLVWSLRMKEKRNKDHQLLFACVLCFFLQCDLNLFASLSFGHRSFKAELWPFFESIRNHEISMHVILVSYLFSKPKLTFDPIARCHFCVSQQRKLHTSGWTASVRRWPVSLTFLRLHSTRQGSFGQCCCVGPIHSDNGPNPK